MQESFYLLSHYTDYKITYRPIGRIYFWSKDGTLLGKAECRDIFQASYPWLE